MHIDTQRDTIKSVRFIGLTLHKPNIPIEWIVFHSVELAINQSNKKKILKWILLTRVKQVGHVFYCLNGLCLSEFVYNS